MLWSQLYWRAWITGRARGSLAIVAPHIDDVARHRRGIVDRTQPADIRASCGRPSHRRRPRRPAAPTPAPRSPISRTSHRPLPRHRCRRDASQRASSARSSTKPGATSRIVLPSSQNCARSGPSPSSTKVAPSAAGNRRNASTTTSRALLPVEPAGIDQHRLIVADAERAAQRPCRAATGRTRRARPPAEPPRHHRPRRRVNLATPPFSLSAINRVEAANRASRNNDSRAATPHRPARARRISRTAA